MVGLDEGEPATEVVALAEDEADGELDGVALAVLDGPDWDWLWKQPESRNTEATAAVSRRPFLTCIFVMRTACRRHLPESTAAR